MKSTTLFIRIFLFALFLISFIACTTEDGSFDSGGQAGSRARFASKGDCLYVLNDQTLMTFDVSDSSKIVLKDDFALQSGMETIFPTDSILFLGSINGMFLMDVQDPFHPEYLSSYQHVTSCDPVVVSGTYAYVTLRTDPNNWQCSRSVNELHVIDLRDVQKPMQVARYSMVNPKGLAYQNKKIFVCDGLDLVVMDASDPVDLIELDRFKMDGEPYDVIATEGSLVVSYAMGVQQYVFEGDSLRSISNVW